MLAKADDAHQHLITAINDIPSLIRYGEVVKFNGLMIEANGPADVFIGEICALVDCHDTLIMTAEVCGFDQETVFLMPFGREEGIRQGLRVRASNVPLSLPAGEQLLGRVVNGLGEPLDDKGPFDMGTTIPLCQSSINPLKRQPITEIFDTGIAAIDSMLTIGFGQRLGIFAGSGVGKSMLLGMIAQTIQSDINIIALIGERGREVIEFVDTVLGKSALSQSVVIVATADESALMRRQAAITANTLAESFCQQGKQVTLMMDSITRFAMAQREISLALGEPPTARGYTPSVFSSLPMIVERVGNFKNQGSITGFYTVLVEGDDFNEPIADTMRALLDGHIVLSRALAHSGHYPAIDMLQSLSRLSSQLINTQQQTLVRQIISLIHCYDRSKDMIEVGAYKAGINPELDQAVNLIDSIRDVFKQSPNQHTDRNQILDQLATIMAVNNE